MNTLNIFYGLSNQNYNKISIGLVENYMKFFNFNNDIELKKWDFKKSIEFVKKYFPEYLKIYTNVYDYRYKCDLVRLMVLYINGGYYMDIDAECLCDIEKMDITKKTELAVVYNDRKDEIFNTFIYVKNTNSPYIKRCIDKYAELLTKKNIGACPIMKTVFDEMYKNVNIGINDNITILQERPLKKLEECSSKVEFWNSFYIFNSNNEPVMKSRYDNYYKDKNDNNNMIDFI